MPQLKYMVVDFCDLPKHEGDVLKENDTPSFIRFNSLAEAQTYADFRSKICKVAILRRIPLKEPGGITIDLKGERPQPAGPPAK